MGDTLTAGQKLGRGDSLTSNNGAYTLTLQEDGNLVLAVRGEAVWATGTNGQGVDRAEHVHRQVEQDHAGGEAQRQGLGEGQRPRAHAPR